MKRMNKTIYRTNSGRELIELAENRAKVIVVGCTADELDELAMACRAAAEELRSLAEVREPAAT